MAQPINGLARAETTAIIAAILAFLKPGSRVHVHDLEKTGQPGPQLCAQRLSEFDHRRLVLREVARELRFGVRHWQSLSLNEKGRGRLVDSEGTAPEGEEPLAAARREFAEETGFAVDGRFVALGEFRQPGGKVISAWLVEPDCDAAAVKSNHFAMEWPPKSGKTAEFPEVDRAGRFAPEDAFVKILRGQRPILERALIHLGLGLPD